MDYSVYTQEPQFSSSQARRAATLRRLVRDRTGSKQARFQKKLNTLYRNRQKARSAYGKPAYGPGSLSRAAVDQQVVAGVRSKFGHEIDATGERQRHIQGYYDSWNKELGNLQSQQAANAQNVIANANANATSTQQNEQSANSDLLAKMQADAAKRGATVDPAMFLKANQASAARSTTNATQTNQMGAQQQAYNVWGGQQSLINRAQKQQTLDRERGYTSKLHQDAADHARELRGNLDQSSWDRALGVKTLGVKVAQNAAANEIAWARVNKPTGGSGGGGGGGSDSDSAVKVDKTARDQYWKYKGQANTVMRRGILKRGDGREYIDKLVSDGADELLATAAVMRALYGGVDRKTRRRVYSRYGFLIPLSASEKKKGR